MDIKLLALDLDGTLLDDSNTVSALNATAVQKARQLGIKICICTGRVNCETEYAAVQAGGCDYLITCNGSSVYDVHNRTHLYINLFPYSLCQRVIDVLDNFGMFYQIYIDDAVCCPAHLYEDLFKSPLNKEYMHMFSDTHILLENPKEDIINKKLDVFKFYVPNFDKELISKVRRKVSAISGIEVTYSSPYSLEIFQTGMDKLNGLTRLVDHMGISFDEVMAIGDSENDFQIIKASKYGIAMSNADRYIRNAAYMVTKSYKDSGVAHAINEIILKPNNITL